MRACENQLRGGISMQEAMQEIMRPGQPIQVGALQEKGRVSEGWLAEERSLEALSFSRRKTLVQDPQCLTLEPQIPERQPLLNTSPICASRVLSAASPISSSPPFVFVFLCRLRLGLPTRPYRVGARCLYIPFLAYSCIECSSTRRPCQPASYCRHTHTVMEGAYTC
jgi:hypothetical protein